MMYQLNRGALTLLACVGMATGVWAQNSTPGNQPSTPSGDQPGNRQGTPMKQDHQKNAPHNTTGVRSQAGTMADGDFRALTSLTGTDVVGLNDDAIGDVEDLLIDRGSGRVQYAIITTGTVLGMGGKTIAVPFHGLRWDAAREKFAYSSTAEQLKQYPQWTEKDWSGLVSTSRPADMDHPRSPSTIDDRNRPGTQPDSNTPGHNQPAKDTANSPGYPGRPADPATSTGLERETPPFRDYYFTQENRRSTYWDPYASNLDTSTQKTITGEVTSVDRRGANDRGEQTLVTIRDQSGQEHRVALGPSWYMSGVPAAPRRGDQITVNAWNTRSGTGNTTSTIASRDASLVASSYRLNDQEVRLRENQNTQWSQRSYEDRGRWYAQPYARHILGSALDGAKLECRGTACGSVDEVIVDVNSGRVAFLSIDPDRNFLGIGDTKYLVPWSVVTVGLDNTVRVDTTKDMMLAGQKTPSDLKELRGSGYTDQVYRAYGVSAPEDWGREPDPATGTGYPRDQMDRDRQDTDPNRTDPSRSNPDRKDPSRPGEPPR